MKRFKHSRLLLTVGVLAVLLVGTTLALQVSGAVSLQNLFSAADNETIIEEKGDEKQVSIVNNSDDPTYVRARVTVESGSDDAALPPELTVVYDTTGQYSKDGSEAPADTIVVVFDNNQQWVASADGFYYYQGIVDGKGKISFVKKVLVGPGVNELLSEQGTTFQVIVYEESALALESTWTQEGMEAAFAKLG